MLGDMRILRSVPFAFIILLVACGGGAFPVAPVAKSGSVTISPPKAILRSQGVQQFTAKVAARDDQGVYWSTTAGTVSSSGVFSAPTVTVVTTVLITAKTKTNSATVSVTIRPPTSAGPSPIPIPAPAQTGQHSVDLSWHVSTATNILGYNVYRRQAVDGLYSKLNTGGVVASTLYTDTTVTNGMTYYYVATVIDNSGRESAHSNQAQVAIPQ
jgi:predicted phage tail protein